MVHSWSPGLHAGQAQHVAQVSLLHGVTAERQPLIVRHRHRLQKGASESKQASTAVGQWVCWWIVRHCPVAAIHNSALLQTGHRTRCSSSNIALLQMHMQAAANEFAKSRHAWQRHTPCVHSHRNALDEQHTAQCAAAPFLRHHTNSTVPRRRRAPHSC
jgi:hypothetical protein